MSFTVADGVALVVSLMGALGGGAGLVALLQARAGTRKIRAEAAGLQDKLTDAALERAREIMDTQARDIKELRERLDKKAERVEELQALVWERERDAIYDKGKIAELEAAIKEKETEIAALISGGC